jgi:integrase
MEWIERNPAEGMTRRRRGDADDVEKAFTDEELQRLFGPEFAALRERKPEKYWVPLVGLFRGARVEEVAGLMAEDVRQVEGAWAIEVRPNELRKLKTAASRRMVPMHSELEALGFLGYVEERGKRGGGPLFPELAAAKNGPGDAASKAFAYWRKRVGVGTAGEGRSPKSFHSFRHALSARLEDAGVEQYAIDVLGGWRNPTRSTGVYGGKRIAMAALREAIEKLDFREGLKNLPR